MRLESEIHQKQFASPAQKLGVNLLYTGAWMHGRIAAWLRSYGLSHQQYNVLRILRGAHSECVSVAYVAKRMLDRASNVSRLVERLRRNGYVERTECPEDRRAVDLAITDSGLSLLESLDHSENEWLSDLSHLSTREVRQLNRLLDAVRGESASSSELAFDPRP